MKKMRVKEFFIAQESIKSTGIITDTNLGSRILDGKRGYMNRGVWPLEVIINGERVTDKEKMRCDYVNIPTLVRELTETLESSYILWRANIPMNLGVGWYEDGQWFLHSDDNISLDRISETPLIELSPSSGPIRKRVISDQGNLLKGHIAVLTPCLGQNEFDEDLLISGTYDPRHLVNLNYSSVGLSDPYTRTLVELAELFTKDRKGYVEKVKGIIYKYPDKPDWSKYPRTLIVIGQRGIEFYSYERGLFTPVTIFDYVKGKTEVGDNFSVFGFIEGGSFTVGLVNEEKVYEIGVRENKSYSRPPAGLWLGYMEINKRQAEKIMEIGVTEVSAQKPNPSQ